ncbi:MAG: YicC family protein [Victivallales bacterium]|nr:YicC family protein [Victivallales bacterium]
MRSMTGFGQAVRICPKGIEFKTEVKTYNRKQLDIKFSLPPELFYYEAVLRRIGGKKISRGSVNIKVNMNFTGDIVSETVDINRKLSEAYLKKSLNLKKELGLPGEIRIGDILRMPNVLSFAEPDIINKDVEETLKDTLAEAFDNLNSGREDEGAFLAEDILKRVGTMDMLVSQIEPLAERLPEFYKEKLYKRIKSEKFDLHDNDERLLRELVVYSDKCDVSEEITRLKSHFNQYRTYIKETNKPVGRTLDFLTQEIQREINTLGVKAATPDISRLVVTLKTETEKIREQVQNIE